MMNPATDVVVVGGGVHGLSAALRLARERLRVTLLERACVGRHASGATAAGVRTLNRAMEELPLSLESMEMWHRLKSDIGDDCGFQAGGQIRVAETASAFEELTRRATTLHELGYRHVEIIEGRELRRLLPVLGPGCVGALIARRDGSADPHRTLQTLRRSAEAAGVTIREGVGVTGIERPESIWRIHTDVGVWETPVVVNTAGAWGGEIARMVGDTVPLVAQAPMMIVTEALTPFTQSVVSVEGRKLSFKQMRPGTLVIGGGMQGVSDPARERAMVRVAGLRQSARNVTAVFPMLESVRITRLWAGLEGFTPDELPILGPSTNAPGIFHAFGFSGHGFQLFPIVGMILADLIVRGHTRHPIAPFTIDRFTSLDEGETHSSLAAASNYSN